MDISVTELKGDPANKFFRREVSLISRECYDFYRANRRSCPKAINQYNLFVKAVEGLFNVMQEMMTDSEGGIYIQDVGYWANVKVKAPYKKGKSLLLRAKQQYYHVPYFFPDEQYKDWTMSGTFKVYIKKRLRDKGVKYKLRFDLTKTLAEAQSFAQKAYYDKRRQTNK